MWGANTYSTALLIGEKVAMLIAEDLGYLGEALDMNVHIPAGPYDISHRVRIW